MLLRYYFLCLLLFYCIGLPAQNRNVVKKEYAFFTIHLPGNIPVNEKGEAVYQIDTFFSVYLVTSVKDVSWEKGWANGFAFNFYTGLLNNHSVEVGKAKLTGKKITVSAPNKHFLWKLDLQPTENKSISPVKIKPNEILIQGRYRKKIFYHKIKKIVELQSMPAV